MRNFWACLFTLSIIGCSLNDSDPILKESIEFRLTDSLGILNFDELTDFDWDEMIVLPPYSRCDKIEEDNDIEFTRSRNSPIASFDHYREPLYIPSWTERLGSSQKLDGSFEPILR